MQKYSTENVRNISIQKAQESLAQIMHFEKQLQSDEPFQEDPSARQEALHSAIHTLSQAWREMILRKEKTREVYEKALSICAQEEELGNPEGKLVLLETELKLARKDMEKENAKTDAVLKTAELLMKTDPDILEQQQKNLKLLPSKKNLQKNLDASQENLRLWQDVLRASTQLVWKNVMTINGPDNITLGCQFLKEAENALEQHQKTPDDLNCAPVFFETKLSVTLTHYETFMDLKDKKGMAMAVERMEQIVATMCEYCPKELEEPSDRTIIAVDLIDKAYKNKMHGLSGLHLNIS